MGMFWRMLGIVWATLLLSIVPMPPQIQHLRPAWVLLGILYVQAYMPACFSIALMVLLGLALDALLVTPMGEHAFALITVVWSMLSLMQRFVFFSTFQQMLIIGVACLGYQGILSLADASFGYADTWISLLGVPCTTLLVWPFFLKLILWKKEPHRHRAMSLIK